uniref:Uncharacterized protein n=1 Tax=Arundo donax TaxID=35708 RepID=A0A0A8Z4C5_ARUDO
MFQVLLDSFLVSKEQCGICNSWLQRLSRTHERDGVVQTARNFHSWHEYHAIIHLKS